MCGITTVYHCAAADRQTSVDGIAFTWDGNGNLLNDDVYTYSYDYANRLVTASGQNDTYSYAYDGLDNRYRQTADGQTTTYILDQAVGLSQVLSTVCVNILRQLINKNKGGGFQALITEPLHYLLNAVDRSTLFQVVVEAVADLV